MELDLDPRPDDTSELNCLGLGLGLNDKWPNDVKLEPESDCHKTLGGVPGLMKWIDEFELYPETYWWYNSVHGDEEKVLLAPPIWDIYSDLFITHNEWSYLEGNNDCH